MSGVRRLRARLGAIWRAAETSREAEVLRGRLAALEAAHHETRLLADHATAVAARANGRVDEQLPRLDDLDSRTAGEAEKLAVLHRHELAIDRLQRQARIVAVEHWLAGEDVPTDTLVSVITPSRNRARLLPAALASLQAQRYPNWEWLVVDDGSTDDTAEVLAALARDEPRLRCLSTTGLGATSARNVGLDAARGELIAYLDDDNRMAPLWLHAVVWAFSRWPEHTALYGARLIDDPSLLHGDGPGSMPGVQFEPYDRPTLRRGNFADMGTIAHRASAGVRFDEDTYWFGDWDLFLQLTEAQPPLELPVVALHYTTAQADRLSGREDAYTRPEAIADAEAIRARWVDR